MSLLEICRHRILQNMIRATRASLESSTQGAFVPMIVDECTLRIISSSCKVYDVLEAGVTVVELINKRRQPLQQLDAIYFLTVDKKSVEMLVKDFVTDKKAQYKSAHIFFSSPITNDPELMQMIAKSNFLLPRLKTFVDFNLNFIAYESRVFHLDSGHMLPQLFPTLQNPGTLRKMAEQLATLCVTLGDKPKIRFHNNGKGHNEMLATVLQEQMNKINPEGVTKGQSQILILDRTIDVAALLVHEYTYQALAYDILEIPCSTPIEERQKSSDPLPPDDAFDYETTTNKGEKELKTAILGENDELYQKYKHLHITHANATVTEEVKRFAQDNAVSALRGKKDASSSDTVAAIRALPQYSQMLSKYWTHVTLSESCFKELQRHGVMKVGGVEQDLATGVDRDGKPVNPPKCVGQIGNLLTDPSVGNQEKVRLLLLYFVTMDGVKEDDRRKMVEAATLSLDLKNKVQNFLNLGLHASQRIEQDTSGQLVKHTHKLANEADRLAFFQRKAKSSDLELSRFEPAVKQVMEKFSQDNLHSGLYPFLEDPNRQKRVGIEESTTQSRGTASVRARDMNWDWGTGDVKPKTAAGANPLAGMADGSSSKKPFFIVFVIGGITMSEMRSCYEVARQSGQDILIGGNCILTPSRVLGSLKTAAW